MQYIAPILFGLYVVTIPFPFVSILWRIEHGFYYYEFTSLAFYWADLAAIVLLALGLMASFWPSISFNGAQKLFVSLLLGIVLLSAVSIIPAIDPNVALIYTGRLLLLLILAILLVHMPFPPSTLMIAFGCFVVFHGIVGIVQFLTQESVGLYFLGEYRLAPEPGYSIIFGEDQTWLRAYGVSSHPNIMGGMLASALFFIVPAYRTATRPWRPILGLIILIGVYMVTVTFSRSAWLGLAVGGAFYAAVQWRSLWTKPMLVLGASLFILGGLFVWQAQPILFARFTPMEGETVTQSTGEREMLTQIAWQLMAENRGWPLGSGNFSLRLLEMDEAERLPSIHAVHNVSLLLGVELGRMGGLLWLVLLTFPPIYTLMLAYRGECSPWLAGATAALMVLAATDFFDHYSWNWAQGRMWRWLLFALWLKAISREQQMTSNE